MYITGSNANLLSSELATLLSGRYIEVKMLPLSFKEYKSFYSYLSNDDLYQKYISFGSLPFTTTLETEDDISIYLSSIYNDIIIKDVMTHKKITDETLLRTVANYALDNISNLVSSNYIATTMTSDGKDINVRTVDKYLEGFVESFFLYKASRYDIKGKQYLKTGKKCYLSPILDGFNGEVISYNTSKSPNLEQINDMLDKAFDKNNNLEGLIFHSDQGWQYQHQSYQQRLKNKGIKQSMSRKGNSMDNGMMENFFGLLKTEMFYDQEDKYKTIDELISAIDDYINYYNYDRIKAKLKGLFPINYRLQSSN